MFLSMFVLTFLISFGHCKSFNFFVGVIMEIFGYLVQL
jgi:hypothetical protein